MSQPIITVEKSSDGQMCVFIANVPLEKKLDVLAALTGAIREAHGDTMSPKSWAAMNRAQEQLAEAMIHLNNKERPALPAPVQRLRVT